MSEASFQEKTEAPTPKRRREAAEKGEVPRSQEVTTAFLLMAAAAVMAIVAGPLATSIVDVFTMAVMGVTAPPVGPDGTALWMGLLGRRTLVALAPPLLALSGTALALAAAQARGTLTLKPLKPQWNRLDPMAKAKQIWGSRAWVELLKSLFKLAVVVLAVRLALGSAIGDLYALGASHPFALLVVVQKYAVRMLLFAGGAYLVLALADYGWQVFQHEKRLKMTRQEVKKENKDAEGDQVVKVRRRTMARQFARRRMLLAVSEADVVVTNPTHIAVALKYDPTRADAPIVLAMGERKVAKRIRELADGAGVPRIENKPLARALYATATIGQPIPVDLFLAVAEVLAWVFKNRGSAPGSPAGRPAASRMN